MTLQVHLRRTCSTAFDARSSGKKLLGQVGLWAILRQAPHGTLPLPQRANRDLPWRARGAPELFPKSGKVGKIIFWKGLGRDGPAKTPPGYHTVHFGLTDSPQTPWETYSSTKPSFFGPHFWPQQVPGPAGTLWGPNLGSGVPKMVFGVENIKVAQ